MTQEIYTKVKDRLYDKLQRTACVTAFGGFLACGPASQTDNVLLMLGAFVTTAASLAYLIGTNMPVNQYNIVQPEENIDKSIEPTDDIYTLITTPKETE